MPVNGETLYTFRTRYPDVLERARAQTVTMPAYRDGSLVAPTEAGSTFTLVDPAGNAVTGLDGVAVTVTGGIATYAITADKLPDTLDLATDYQTRWSLVMPDGTTRTPRREAAVTRFQLHPPCTDTDITSEYPNLVTELAQYQTDLQTQLDEAWAQLLNRFFGMGRWPDQMVSSSSCREPHRQLTMFLVFKALFRFTNGSQSWERLMDYHRDECEKAWGALSARWDWDNDGVADGAGSALGVLHRSGAPSRRLRKDPRW